MTAWQCGLNRGRCLGAIVLILVALAPAALAATQPSPVQVRVLENSDQIVLQYTIGDYQLVPVTIGGQQYQQIGLAHEAVMLNAGAPALPKVARSVIIPDDAEMTVQVLSANFKDVNTAVVPSKGNLSRTIDPATVPYAFGPEYGVNAFYPGDLVELGDPYVLRDVRGVAVTLYPFQYNPVTGILRVYTDITIAISATGPSQVNALDRSGFQRTLVRSFDELYTAHFLNYNVSADGTPQLRYNPLDEQGNLLIIVPAGWISNMQPLATHKNSIGISTTIVDVATIGNNATSIKSYIQNLYNTSDLAFVLLVGDSTQVVPPYGYAGGAVDPTYAKVAGSDNYPDIFIGRFSAETAAQVDTQVQRTVEYETMPATQQAWFWKGVGIGSEYGTGDDGEYDYQHIDNIRTLLMAHGYTAVDQLYTSSATAAQVSAALNSGRGIVNYCGHGSDTSWGTTGFANGNVTALTNDNMLPFIFSVACVNGNFPGQTCFAEAWLRSMHNGEPIGAIGTYMSSVNQSWDPPMQAQDEFNALYTAGTYHYFGVLCYAGSCSMMDDYGGGTGGDGTNMFDTWHVFGDPSLRIVGVPTPPHGIAVTPEDTLSATGPHGGPFTPGSIAYTIENMGDTPLDYAVTKTQSWISLTNATGTLVGGATVTITVSINAGANALGDGHYADTITFTNVTDGDGDTTRALALKVGVPIAQYSWPLDSDPGWTISGGQWAFGHPVGGGGSHGYADPANGYTGSNVYGVNLSGDYSTTAGGPYNLTLGPVDLSGMTEVSLKFKRWLNTDITPYVTNTVQISTNGTSWTTIWTNGTTVINESGWSSQSYDISAMADNQAAVYVRWTYKVANYAWAYSGWNIDDVEIWAFAPSGPSYPLGDMNCDLVVNNQDIDAFVMALFNPAGYIAQYPDCDILNGDFTADDVVNNQDIDAFVAALFGD